MGSVTTELLLDYVEFLLSKDKHEEAYCIMQVAVREAKHGN